MNVAIFGATGSLGSECLRQSMEAGHEITVLVRTSSKLLPDLPHHILDAMPRQMTPGCTRRP